MVTGPRDEIAPPDMVEQINRDCAEGVEFCATSLLGQAKGAWRIADIDPEGMDLVLEDAVVRYWFKTPATTGPGLRRLLDELVRDAD